MKKHGRTRFSSPDSVLCYLRVYYGVSQQRLAKECGVSFATVQKLEKRMALNEPAKYLNFNCGTIRKVSEYFNVTPDAIIRNSFTSLLPSLGPMPDLRPKARKRIREAQDKFGRIGEDGEDFVVRMERKKLKGTEYAKGINANFANDPSKGFDVFSFTRDGLPLYIEVKATVGRWNEEFHLSENEYQFLEYCLEKGMRYELHRVYNLKSKGGPKVKVYTAEEVLKLHFKATE